MKTPVCLIAGVALAALNLTAQTPPVLNAQIYAGLTITGAVGTVYLSQQRTHDTSGGAEVAEPLGFV